MVLLIYRSLVDEQSHDSPGRPVAVAVVFLLVFGHGVVGTAQERPAEEHRRVKTGDGAAEVEMLHGSSYSTGHQTCTGVLPSG